MEPSTLATASASTDAAQQPTPSTVEVNGIIYKLDSLIAAYHEQFNQMEDKIQDSVNSKLLNILNERGYGDLARHIINAYGRDEMLSALLRSKEIYDSIGDKLLDAMHLRLNSEMDAVIETKLNSMRIAMGNEIRSWVRDELALMDRADNAVSEAVTTSISSHFLHRMKNMLASELRSTREDLEARYSASLDAALHEVIVKAPARQQATSEAEHPGPVPNDDPASPSGEESNGSNGTATEGASTFSPLPELSEEDRRQLLEDN